MLCAAGPHPTGTPLGVHLLGSGVWEVRPCGAELVVRKVDIAIKGKRNEDEIPKPGLGSIDTLLGTVAGVLTHCARNSGGAVTCVDLLHQNREAIERACVACVEE